MKFELREKLAGRLVVASVSGGKDSAALSLWLKEQGIEHRRVFMDTGWEHPATYAYLRGELARVIGPIEEIRSAKYPGGMIQMVDERGALPSRTRRFCTEELKLFPMRDYLAQLAGDAINAVGVRAEESDARAKMTEWEWSKSLDAETSVRGGKQFPLFLEPDDGGCMRWGLCDSSPAQPSASRDAPKEK